MRRVKRTQTLLAAIICSIFFRSGAAGGEETIAPPAWTTDARWYYIVVPRFHSGESANNPNDTLPWTATWLEGMDTSRPISVKTLMARRYGGDVQGIKQRLPYLKKLGVNTLCLASLFQGSTEGYGSGVDLRHVDSRVGVKGGSSETDQETSDPATWVWTGSDRAFLDLVRSAHTEGLRVVVTSFCGAFSDTDAKLGQMESYGQAILRRWIDPNGDGDPSDGVDGLMHGLDEAAFGVIEASDKAAWRRLRELARNLNPNFVVIDSGALAAGHVAEGMFDLSLSSEATVAIERFFHPAAKALSGKSLLIDLDRTSAALRGESRAAGPQLMSLLDGARLLTRLSESEAIATRTPPSAGPAITSSAVDRWRLATIVQHLALGTPLTFYGDEVGMTGGASAFARAPMWWDDLPEPATKATAYRNDFFALVEWLHALRAKYPALRTGAFRAVFHDDDRKLLAFARTLPGDEMIVVLNYGDAKQEVQLPAGTPGQLVALMSPQIPPPPPPSPDAPKKKSPRQPADPKKLLVGGSRQFVNDAGKVSLWVDRMSARLILVNDIEPRRP
jgi:hypothetical protein